MRERRAIRGRAHPSPGVLNELLLRAVFGVPAGKREPEIFRHRPDVGKVEAGFDLPGVGLERTRSLLELVRTVPPHQIGVGLEFRARTLEGAARNHVHRAGERRALRLGRRRVLHLDPGSARDRRHVHLHAARRTAVAAGARHREAVDRDRNILGRHPVDRDPARQGTRLVLDGDTGQKFQKLAHAPLGHVAELIGRDHALDVGGETLLVDRDRRAVHVARR
jgi:hypothetical protein